MATWPSTFVIKREAYKETPPDRVLRSKMAVGPDKLRRRSSSDVRKVNFVLSLTDALLVTFDAFYLANDSIAFTFPDPRTATNVQARFVSPPVFDNEETIWNVGVQLEILP